MASTVYPQLSRDTYTQRRAREPGSVGGLPRPLTSFVGRERQIAEVRALIERDDVRLVTLTGPGGVGKTRLALRVATAMSDFLENVWFVALASVGDISLVPGVIARALDIVDTTSGSAEDEVNAALVGTPGLLVLDNVEQLPEIGGLIASIVVASPQTRVLVTSRSVLRVSGEHVYAVPPLATPAASLPLQPGQVEQIESVRLFVERARASVATFELTPQLAPDVVAICRQVNGLPLAIELAAARVGTLSTATLRERMSKSGSLLRNGPRDEPPRLQSMRDSISWSYDLLSPAEQDVFVQLGVFSGTWTLEAAEAVIGGSESSDAPSVMECVAALVQHSLVCCESTPVGTPYYLMLETIRQFAAELLQHRHHAEAIRQRYISFIESLAAKAQIAVYRSDGACVFARLHIHIADILKALDHLDRDGESDRLLKVVSDLAYFWGCQGRGFEGRPWLERAVTLGRRIDSPYLGNVLVTLAGIVHGQGDADLAWSLAEEGKPLLQDQARPVDLLHGLACCGILALRRIDLEGAAAWQDKALKVVPLLPAESWATCAESMVLGHLGNVAVAMGEIDRAHNYFTRAIERQTALGFARGTSHFMASHPLAGLGDVERARNNPAAALNYYQEALEIAKGYADYRATVYALGGVAGTLAASGQWQTAAVLFGAAEALHQARRIHFELETTDRQRALGLPEPWFRATESFGSGQPLRDRLAASGSARIAPIPDPDRAAALWTEGAWLTLEEATALALGADTTEPTTECCHSLLSPRELDVLRLLVEGHTDAEIAAQMFISRRTASTHVRHIYDKIEVSSRAGATAWALRNGLA